MSPAVFSNVTIRPSRRLGKMLSKLFSRFSWTIFLPLLALVAVGILAIYLADHPSTQPFSSSKPWRIILANRYLTQLAFFFFGMLLFFVLVIFDYRRLGRYAYFFFGTAIILLIIVRLLPPASAGVHRWLAVGPIRLGQPSEFAKIAFILALAWYLRFRKSHRTFVGFLLPFAFALVPMFLIVIEPDLGTSLLFLPTLIVVLFAAGARKRHITVIFLLGLLSLPVLWLKMSDYQQSRIVGWLKQGQPSVSAGTGFQLNRSLIAIGSGGPYGQPFRGAEVIEHDLLVHDHTDFIFAVIAAQFGLLGTSALLLLYLILFAFGLRIAQTTYDPFGRLIAVGVVAMLATQTVINIAMTLGLLPVTGMTLPFVSYGGSSLLASLIALGLLVSVGKHNSLSLAQRPFEFDSD